MAYPAGVPTRVVSIGSAWVLESSDPLKLQITVKSSRSLIWTSTGDRFESVERTVSATTPGTAITVELPVTDAAGWRDADTHAAIDLSLVPGSNTHTYTVVLKLLDAANGAVGTYTIGPFIVPSGSGTIDLDLLVNTSPVLGVLVPDVWSAAIAALQGQVAALEAGGGGGGGGGGGTVTSVNGKSPVSGAVTLVPSDIGAATASQGTLAGTAVQPGTLTTALAAKADLVSGLVPTSQLPSLSLTTAVPVADQAAMLALTSTQVQPGDIAVRADGAGSFILLATPASTLSNWLRINAPTDVVTTVNGQAGTVVLSAANVGALAATLAAVAGLLTSLQAGTGISVDIAYAAAAALGTRPALPANWHFRIWGGLTTDPDPSWMTSGDWRHIPA